MPKQKARARPIQVRYYRHVKCMPDDYDRMGHCKKEVGVLRGAVVRLFLGEYAMARVYKDGINIMTVRMRGDGLPELRFGPHILGTVLPDGSIRSYEAA